MFGNNQQNQFFNYGYSGQMMDQAPFYPEWNTVQNYTPRLPYPVPHTQNYQLQPYQPQNQYLQGGFPPSSPDFHPGYMQQSMPNQYPAPQPYSPQQQYPQQDSQFLFHNPLQPQEEMYQNQYQPLNGYPNMNPYPKQNMFPNKPGGMQSFMNSFKSQDGSVDFNKMVNTAGQMMNAVSQVSSLVKGLGGIFKS